jgi:translin
MESIEKEVKGRVARRDRLGEMARTLRRSSQEFMRHLHEERGRTPGRSLLGSKKSRSHQGRNILPQQQELREMAQRLIRELEREGWREEGVVEAALQEWVEASLLWAIVEGHPFPTPSELGVHAEAYLLGLADVVGELRRLTITALGRAEVDTAKALLEDMDDLAGMLMRFDFPRSVLSMKPKQDMARSLVERTRGDVEVARFMNKFVSQRSKRSKG